MGSSFEKVESVDEAPLVSYCLDQLSTENYFVLSGSKEITVGLSPEANPEIKAKAYFHACMMRKALRNVDLSTDVSLRIHSAVSFEVQDLWPLFTHSASSAGWDLTKTELSTNGFCVTVQHA